MEAASKRDLNRFFERWIYDNAIPRLRFSSAVEGQELIVRFEQSGDIFDVPVTVAVTYADGKTAEFLVIADQAIERGAISADRHGAIGRAKPGRRVGRAHRPAKALAT